MVKTNRIECFFIFQKETSFLIHPYISILVGLNYDCEPD